jgi:hypothetical protein
MTTRTKEMLSAVFRDHTTAQRAYERLLNRGYMGSEINVLMSDATRQRHFDDPNNGNVKMGTHAAEGVAAGGAIGTAVGATLAVVTAIAAGIAIPGIGLFIAGPVAAALAGGGAGAVAGGAIGGLIGMGIPESNAQAFHEALKNGGVALGVVPHNGEDADRIQEDFKDLDGENVCYA